MDGPNSHKRASDGRGPASPWDADGAPGIMGAFLVGEDPPDYSAFMAMIKEAGRYLNAFVPPEGFQPEGPAREMPLSPEKARDMGAGSMRDFYLLALNDDEARSLIGREGQGQACFPRGPESVKPVLQMVESKVANISKAIGELNRSWPAGEPGLDAAIRPLEHSLAVLQESRANLIRVVRDMWPRMKEEALAWPKDARRLWQKSQSLKQSVHLLLKAAREGAGEPGAPVGGERGRRSLSRAMTELKNQVAAARSLLEKEDGWNANLERLMSDLDDYLAVVADGNQADRNWDADNRWLTGRYNALDQESRRLKEDAAAIYSGLRKALDALVETETRLSGRHGGETLEGLETVNRGVQALWRSAFERRRQMARIYFFLPSRLGRPVFIEKSLMATAQALGRTQSLLEDLRHRLSLAGSRLSTTHRLRSDGQELVESIKRPNSRQGRLKTARKRLTALARVVEQRLSLKAARGELEGALAREEENELEISRGRAENSRIYRELKAAALERDQLADQLVRARQKLKEVGLVKARLLKVFAHKSAIWDDIERSRQRLLSENESLKSEREELKRKRSLLADLYSKERRELKALSVELKEAKDDLAVTRQYAEQRDELEKRLQETRDERQAIDDRRREVETRLQEQAAQLAAARARGDSLAAELARHREELAAASRARLTLGEKAAALRRRQDLMSQAHDSLQKALSRKGRRLAQTESERDGLVVRLNRQKRNILRLVTIRQELRADLGSARLKLVDLENERQDLFAQLDQAQAEIQGGREELAESERGRQDLLSANAGLESANEGLMVTNEGLVVANEGLMAANKELTAANEDLTVTNEELTADIDMRALANAELKAANAELAAAKDQIASANDELAAANASLGTANKELAAANASLGAANKDLAAEKEALNEQLRALADEKNAVVSRLEDLEREKDELSALMEADPEDGGLRQRLAVLIEEKNILAARVDGLTDERSRLAFRITDLERHSDELSAQLDQLKSQVSEDLLPFIKVMGQALWRSEATLLRARNSSGRMTQQFQFEAEVREADLRLKSAGRELEIAEAGRAVAADLENRLKAQGGELDEMRRQRDELGQSAQHLESRNQRLRRAVGILKTQKSDLQGFLESQGRDLEDQKARLAQLEPLVAHFFEAASSEGSPMPGPAVDPAVLRYMKDNSSIVSAELNLSDDATAAEPGSFALDGAAPADDPLVAQLKARLDEMRPLVAFLARSFIAGVSDLAQARMERSALSEELAKARHESDTLGDELRQAKEHSEGLGKDLARSQEEVSVLSGQLSLVNSTKAILENSLVSREAELAEVRDQAFALVRERDQLRQGLDEKKDEVGTLKNELAQADRDLTENDGRLEAAWAAMNYLGTRAGDTLGSMKNKLDGQVRQIDNLTVELKKRETVIKTLEERQDKLALLYWALVSRAASARPSTLDDGDDFGPIEVPLELELEDHHEGDYAVGRNNDDSREAALDNAKSSGGHSLGRGILEGVKKVARRSLFTLILAGGLVMGGSVPIPALPHGPAFGPSAPVLTPQLGAAPPSAGGDLRSAAGSGFNNPKAFPSSDDGVVRYLSSLDSTYIGRPVGLERVAPELRTAGRSAIESRLAEMVAELAESHGLSNGEFLRLVRTVRAPEQTVYLDDFKGPAGAAALLGGHFPLLARQLLSPDGIIFSPEKTTSLMKAAADFKNREGGYWERLYFDLAAFGLGEAPGGKALPKAAIAGENGFDAHLEALLRRLEDKKSQSANVRTEFAGRLAPFSEVENLGPDRFINFMGDYIADAWPSFSGRNRVPAAQKLAADIYFAARTFKLPVTLLAAVIHEEAETDAVDFFMEGATLGLHERAADLAELTGGFTRVWLEGRPPLCDLDEALAASEREAFVEAVYRKKMAMVMAYNKSLNIGSSLFPDSEEER